MCAVQISSIPERGGVRVECAPMSCEVPPQLSLRSRPSFFRERPAFRRPIGVSKPIPRSEPEILSSSHNSSSDTGEFERVYALKTMAASLCLAAVGSIAALGLAFLYMMG